MNLVECLPLSAQEGLGSLDNDLLKVTVLAELELKPPSSTLGASSLFKPNKKKRSWSQE